MRVAILIVYDLGSAAPTRLAEAARMEECELVFLTINSPHCRMIRPVLEMLGTVLEMEEDDSEDDILRSLRRHDLAGITTFAETLIPLTARLARRLSLPYHDIADISAITRKDAQRKRLADSGLTNIRCATVTNAAQAERAIQDVGCPAIVKPIVGAGSRDTFMVKNLAEYLQVARLLLNGICPRHYVVEQLLQGIPACGPWGDYIAVDCIAEKEAIRPLFVTSKFQLAEPFRERGGYGPGSMASEKTLEKVSELGCLAVRELGIQHGIADVEMKLTPSGPQVIEVNGRLGGWVDDIASRSQAANPVLAAVRAALGRSVALPPPSLPSRIAFHYLIVPPMSAVAIESIGRPAALRQIYGVERVTLHKNQGDSTDWRCGTSTSVAAVTGLVDTREELAETINSIESLQWIQYRMVNG